MLILASDKVQKEALARINRLLVDMAYKPGIAAAVKQKVGGSVMIPASGPRNHWSHCLVVCTAAAAIVGVATAAMRAAVRPPRRVLTQADFDRLRTRL